MEVEQILLFAERTRDVLLGECRRLQAAGDLTKAQQVMTAIQDIEQRMRALEAQMRRERLN